MKDIEPKRPENLEPIASDILERLQNAPEAGNLVIGGGVALNCYVTPRLTHDVDAWWAQSTDAGDRAATLDRIREIAREVAGAADLNVFERPLSLSEVVSIELQANRKTVFSFQVAPRDIELEPPLVARSPFAPVPLETLADNLGAKMTALVGRGAPRDFQDVYNVVRSEIARPDELWALFSAKNPGLDVSIAKAQVSQRLGDIELRRPLDTLQPDFQAEAARLRSWVRADLVGQPFEPPAPNLGFESRGPEAPGHESGLEL